MPDIDDRVVRMQFDNQQFEQGVSKSMKTIEDLKKALQFDKTAESLQQIEFNTSRWDFSKLEQAADKISDHFTVIGRVVDQVRDKLASIATMGLGKTMEGLEMAVGIKGYDAGFDKYANKSKSVRQIMAATGDSIERVNKVLDDLMWYTDMTSYDFSEMVASIGKFTSVGVDLETAERSMEGIASWAARSGADKIKANQAMYNLSQAMGMGELKLQDWKSIEIAGMATKEFKETMIDTAIELGKLEKVSDHVGKIVKTTSKGTKEIVVDYTTFREALKEGFADTDVMLGTFEKYADTSTKFGQAAFDDARMALTFKDAMDAIADAMSSGWAKTFEQLFGNANEAAEMWTNFCDSIIEVIEYFSELRTELFKGWHEMGGYNDMLEIAGNLWGIFKDAIFLVKDALQQVFPIFNITSEGLVGITRNIRDITRGWREAFGYVTPLDKEAEEVEESAEKIADSTKGAADSVSELLQGTSAESDAIVDSLGNSAKVIEAIDKDLKKGMRGEDVRKMQEALRNAGYKLDKYGADGIYGPETRAAVKALQKDLGVEQTGIWDKATREAAKQSKVLEGLRKGARGKDVKELQRQLMEAGFKLDKYGADGVFGPETEKALKELQKKLGVEQTGVWDEATKKAAKDAKIFNKTVKKTSKAAQIAVDKIKMGLKRGMRGEEVKKMQEELKKAGYNLDKYGADGIFGPETEKALKKLQSELGVKQTGVWDEATKAAIQNKKAEEEAAAAKQKAAEATKQAKKEEEEAEKVTKRTTPAMERIQNILRGAFSIIRLVGKAFSAIGQIGLNIIKMFEPLAAVFGRFVSMVAGMFYNLDDATDKNNTFGRFVDTVTTLLSPLAQAIDFVARQFDRFISFYDLFLRQTGKKNTFLSFFEYILDTLQNGPLSGVITFALTVFDNLKFIWDVITSWLSTAFNGLMSSLGFNNQAEKEAQQSPIITFLNFILDIATKFVNAIGTVFALLYPIVDSFIAQISPQVIPALQTVGGILKDVLDIAVEAFPKILPLLPFILAAIVAFKALNTVSAITGSRLGLLRLLPILATIVGMIAGKKFGPEIGKFFNSIIENLDKHGFKKAADGLRFIKGKIETAINFITTKIGEFKNYISKAFPEVTKYLDKNREKFTNFFSFSKDKGLIENLKDRFELIKGLIGTFFGSVKTKITTFFSGVFPFVIGKIDEFKSAMKKAFPGVVKYLEEHKNDFNNFFHFDKEKTITQNIKDRLELIKGFFVSVFEDIKANVKKFADWVGRGLAKVGEALTLIFNPQGEDANLSLPDRLKKAVASLRPLIDWIMKVSEPIRNAWNSIFSPSDETGKKKPTVLEWLSKGLNWLISAAGTIISGAWNTITGLLSNFNIKQLLGIARDAILLIALFNFSRAAAGLGKAAKQITNFEASAMWGTELKVDTFGDTALKLAAAIGIITAAVFALSKIDAGAALKGIGVVLLLISLVGGAIAGLRWIKAKSKALKLGTGKKKTTGGIGDILSGVGMDFLGIGVGLVALVAAMKMLYDIFTGEKFNGNAFAGAVGTLIGAIVALGAVSIAMDKLSGSNNGKRVQVNNILQMCGGVFLIVLSLERMLNVIKGNTFWQIVEAMIPIIAILGALTWVSTAMIKAAGKSNAKGNVSASVDGILKMCAGVYVIAMAIEKLTHLINEPGTEGDVVGAIAGIAIILAELGLIVWAMTDAASKNKSGEVKASTTGILAMCAGVYVIAMAIEKLTRLINEPGREGDVLEAFGMVVAVLGLIGWMLHSLSSVANSSKAGAFGRIIAIAASILAFGVSIGIIMVTVAALIQTIDNVKDVSKLESVNNILWFVVGMIAELAATVLILANITKDGHEWADFAKTLAGGGVIWLIGDAIRNILSAVANLVTTVDKVEDASKLDSVNGLLEFMLGFIGMFILVYEAINIADQINQFKGKKDLKSWQDVASQFASGGIIWLIGDAIRTMLAGVSNLVKTVDGVDDTSKLDKVEIILKYLNGFIAEFASVYAAMGVADWLKQLGSSKNDKSWKDVASQFASGGIIWLIGDAIRTMLIGAAALVESVKDVDATKLNGIEIILKYLDGFIGLFAGVLAILSGIDVFSKGSAKWEGVAAELANGSAIFLIGESIRTMLTGVADMLDGIKDVDANKINYLPDILSNIATLVGEFGFVISALSGLDIFKSGSGLSQAAQKFLNGGLIVAIGFAVQMILNAFAGFAVQANGLDLTGVADALWAISGIVGILGVLTVLFGAIGIEAAVAGAVGLFAFGVALGALAGVIVKIGSESLQTMTNALWAAALDLKEAETALNDINWTIFETAASSIDGGIGDIITKLNGWASGVISAEKVADKLWTLGDDLMYFSSALNSFEEFSADTIMSPIEDIVSRIKGLEIDSTLNNTLTNFSGAISLFYDAIAMRKNAIIGEDGTVNVEDALPINPEDIRTAFKMLQEAIPRDVVAGFTDEYAAVEYDEEGHPLTQTAIGIENLATALSSYSTKMKDVDFNGLKQANSILEEFAKIYNSTKSVSFLSIWNTITGYNTAKDFVEAFGKVADIMKTYANNIGGLSVVKVAAANSILLAIGALQDHLPKLGGFISWFEGDEQTIGQFATGMGQLGIGLSNLVTNTKDLKASDFNETALIMERLGNIAKSSSNILKYTYDNGIGTRYNYFEELAHGIGAMIDALKGYAVDDEKVAILDEVLNLGKDILLKIGEGIVGTNGESTGSEVIGEFIGQALTEAIDYVETTYSPEMNEIGSKLAPYIGEGISDAFKKAISTSTKVADERDSQLDITMTEIGKSICTLIAEGVNANTFEATNEMTTLGGLLVSAIEGLYDDFFVIGQQIDSGLAHGITENTWVPVAAATRMATKTTEAAQGVVEVASPSKKFMWIGQMCALGLAHGIKGGEGLVEDASFDLGNASIEEITNALDPDKAGDIIAYAIKTFEQLYTHGYDHDGNIKDPMTLQEFLVATGYLPKEALTGEIDSKTKEAIKKFKEELLGEINPDDEFDRDTAMETLRLLREKQSEGYDRDAIDVERNLMNGVLTWEDILGTVEKEVKAAEKKTEHTAEEIEAFKAESQAEMYDAVGSAFGNIGFGDIRFGKQVVDVLRGKRAIDADLFMTLGGYILGNEQVQGALGNLITSDKDLMQSLISFGEQHNLIAPGTVTPENFMESLSSGWVTSDVLKQAGFDIDELTAQVEAYTGSALPAVDATDAATEATAAYNSALGNMTQETYKLPVTPEDVKQLKQNTDLTLEYNQALIDNAKAMGRIPDTSSITPENMLNYDLSWLDTDVISTTNDRWMAAEAELEKLAQTKESTLEEWQKYSVYEENKVVTDGDRAISAAEETETEVTKYITAWDLESKTMRNLREQLSIHEREIKKYTDKGVSREDAIYKIVNKRMQDVTDLYSNAITSERDTLDPAKKKEIDAVMKKYDLDEWAAIAYMNKKGMGNSHTKVMEELYKERSAFNKMSDDALNNEYWDGNIQAILDAFNNNDVAKQLRYGVTDTAKRTKKYNPEDAYLIAKKLQPAGEESFLKAIQDEMFLISDRTKNKILAIAKEENISFAEALTRRQKETNDRETEYLAMMLRSKPDYSKKVTEDMVKATFGLSDEEIASILKERGRSVYNFSTQVKEGTKWYNDFLQMLIDESKKAGNLSKTANVTVENFYDDLDSGWLSEKVFYSVRDKFAMVNDVALNQQTAVAVKEKAQTTKETAATLDKAGKDMEAANRILKEAQGHFTATDDAEYVEAMIEHEIKSMTRDVASGEVDLSTLGNYNGSSVTIDEFIRRMINDNVSDASKRSKLLGELDEAVENSTKNMKTAADAIKKGTNSVKESTAAVEEAKTEYEDAKTDWFKTAENVTAADTKEEAELRSDISNANSFRKGFNDIRSGKISLNETRKPWFSNEEVPIADYYRQQINMLIIDPSTKQELLDELDASITAAEDIGTKIGEYDNTLTESEWRRNRTFEYEDGYDYATKTTAAKDYIKGLSDSSYEIVKAAEDAKANVAANSAEANRILGEVKGQLAATDDPEEIQKLLSDQIKRGITDIASGEIDLNQTGSYYGENVSIEEWYRRSINNHITDPSERQALLSDLELAVDQVKGSYTKQKETAKEAVDEQAGFGGYLNTLLFGEGEQKGAITQLLGGGGDLVNKALTAIGVDSSAASTISTKLKEAGIDGESILNGSGLKGLGEAMQSIGLSLPTELTSAISGDTSVLGKVQSWINTSIKDPLNGLIDQTGGFGKNLVDGTYNGIIDNIDTGVSGGQDLADAINIGFTDREEMNSPSRLFEQYGIYILEGLANGLNAYSEYIDQPMQDMTSHLTDLAVTMVETVTNAMETTFSESLSRMSSMVSDAAALVDTVNENPDSTPTIRPVVDTSNVDKTTGEINTVLNTSVLGSWSSNIAQRLTNVETATAANTEQMATNTKDMVSSIDSLAKKISTMSSDIAKMKVYLDGNILTGYLTPKLDRGIGGQTILAGRMN